MSSKHEKTFSSKFIINDFGSGLMSVIKSEVSISFGNRQTMA